jgi:hypothetical protein
VVRLLDKAGIEAIDEFDERFRGTQSLFNWIQDLESELWNAGLEDRQFLSARIGLCEEGLQRFPSADDLMSENRRRALAASYFELGEVEKAETLYREWLGGRSALGMGLDRMVGRPPVHARRARGPEPVRADPAGRL